jgi:hypothetical protein
MIPTIKWVHFRPHGHHCSSNILLQCGTEEMQKKIPPALKCVKYCDVLVYIKLYWNIEEDKQCTYYLQTNSVRANNVAVLHIVSVCDLSYPACQGHAPYYSYIVVCGLSGCT